MTDVFDRPLDVRDETTDAYKEHMQERKLGAAEFLLQMDALWNKQDRSYARKYAIVAIGEMNTILKPYKLTDDEEKYFAWYSKRIAEDNDPERAMTEFNCWLFPLLGPNNPRFNFGFKRQVEYIWETK